MRGREHLDKYYHIIHCILPYFRSSKRLPPEKRKRLIRYARNNNDPYGIRNKKRLAKEISQSKELMILLAISTKRDLDESEKKKVKSQLLDICKTIPSLTLFLIPGGSLLLPLLIKFIPQLLPSSFNENFEKNN